MSVQLRVTDDAAARRGAMHPDMRLCLSLVSVGLSAIATLSPAARGVIVASLDDLLASGQVAEGLATDMLVDLRDRANAESDPDVAMGRRIEEALVSKALALKGGAEQGAEDEGTVVTLRDVAPLRTPVLDALLSTLEP